MTLVEQTNQTKKTAERIKGRAENGQAIRTVEQMRLDQEAAQLHLPPSSLSYQQIGDQLGVPKSTAYEMVQRALAEIPNETTQALVAKELAKLDFLENQAALILGRDHPYVTMGGKLVSLLTTEEFLADPSKENDKLLQDDAPKLQAMNLLLKIAQQRAKFLGLYAPTRTELTGAVTVTVEDRGQEAKAAVLGLLARLKEEDTPDDQTP